MLTSRVCWSSRVPTYGARDWRSPRVRSWTFSPATIVGWNTSNRTSASPVKSRTHGIQNCINHGVLFLVSPFKTKQHFFLWTQATKTVLTKTKSDLGSKNAKVFFFFGGGFTWIFKGWFFNKQHVLWFETNSLEQMVGELAVRLYLIIFFYTHTDSQRVTVSTYYKGPLFTTSCIQMTYMSWFQMDLDTSGSLLAARQARSCIMYINPSSPDKRTNNDGRKTTSQIPCCRFRESIIL